MAELEELGFLTHPHTSAGRIPTEQGWRYFLDYIVKDLKLKSAEERALLAGFERAKADGLNPAKGLAKALADLSETAVMVGFGPHDVYYTGLTYLFSQPEFLNPGYVHELSAVIDHLDEAMAEVFKQPLTKNVEVFLGEDNPFGKDCSVLYTTIRLETNQPGILGILGPLRLDYAGNIARLKYARSLFPSAAS
jgi:heat-inducible transcriptional repressor